MLKKDVPDVGDPDGLRGALNGLRRQVEFLLRHQGSDKGRIGWTCLLG